MLNRLKVCQVQILSLMRWGSSGNNGVGASAYALTSEDEKATYYYYQEPTIPSTTSCLGVSQSDQPCRIPCTKKLPTKRTTKRIVGMKTRLSRPSRLSTDEFATDRLEIVPEFTRNPPLIVCAGKSVYSSTNNTGENNRKETNQQSGEYSGRKSEDRERELNCNNQLLRARKISRPNEENLTPRQRTDEELEEIIRDLRGQVFQQQKNEIILNKREKSAEKSNNFDRKETHGHQRKHLKNPVEKMEGAIVDMSAVSTIDSSSATSKDFLLHRPLSSSTLNRFMAESTVQIVVPAIIYEAPPATVRNSTSNLPSFIDSRPSARSCRPGSSSRDNLLSHSEDSNQLNPRRLRTRKIATSTQSRIDKQVSDKNESFLYLVDVEDCENGPESLSLSPLGPWAVENFSLAGTDTITPRSPSVSTCYSLSSFGSEEIDTGDKMEMINTELTTLSPRSRLLYFSACANDSETPRGGFSQRNHRQTLPNLMKISNTTKPKRCSSAKTSTRVRSRPKSSLTTQKQKSDRVNQPRKRPQSGGATKLR